MNEDDATSASASASAASSSTGSIKAKASSRRNNKWRSDKNKIESICVICKDAFLCSKNYRGQKFACWNCRMSSAALEKGFVCPITNTIMFYPVVASDGNCYERHAIQVWIATAVDNERQPLSPATSDPLDNLILKPDNEMRKKIEDFSKSHCYREHRSTAL